MFLSVGTFNWVVNGISYELLFFIRVWDLGVLLWIILGKLEQSLLLHLLHVATKRRSLYHILRWVPHPIERHWLWLSLHSSHVLLSRVWLSLELHVRVASSSIIVASASSSVSSTSSSLVVRVAPSVLLETSFRLGKLTSSDVRWHLVVLVTSLGLGSFISKISIDGLHTS